MKNLNELTEKEALQAIDNAHFNANGVIIGCVPGGLTRSDHVKIQSIPANKAIQFIHTRSFSGAIIVRKYDFVLGACNIAGAGRGYVFESLEEIKKAIN